MRKPVCKLLCLALVLALLMTMAAGCGAAPAPAQTSAAPEPTPKVQTPVKLVFWTSIYQETGSGDKPQSEWYITKAIERFQKANPGITIELVFQSADNFFTLYKAAGIAKNGPDIGLHWPGGNTQGVSDFILPLNKYFSTAELGNMKGLDPCWKGYDNTSDLLAIPLYSQICGIFYNKALFAKAGLARDVEFKDMSELFAACEKLKAAGIQPFVVGEKEGYQSTWFANKLVIAKGGMKFATGLLQGKEKFSNPLFIDAYKSWRELYSKGYTNSDVMSMGTGDSATLFTAGKAAMNIDGIWSLVNNMSILKDDCGFMRVPPVKADDPYAGAMIGSCESNAYVSNYSQHPDEAIKFIKFLVTDEEQIQYCKTIGSLPSSKTVPSSIFEDALHQQIIKWTTTDLVAPYMENMMPKDVEAEWLRLNTMVFGGKITAEEFAQKLDEKMASVSK